MARRELLQLATPFDPGKHRIGGYFISEKLDGTRCFWDGGISRGVPTVTVPWASITDPKTGRRKDKIKPVATGLWSRYGNPIIAPDWFLNRLPACFLDGELWAGRGKFQLCRSICGGDTPDPRFDQIRYVVYSAPDWMNVLGTGEIKNTNMVREVKFDECLAFIDERVQRGVRVRHTTCPDFEHELPWLNKNVETQSDTCYVHRQEKLPLDEGQAHVRVAEFLDFVLEQGGEGVVLRDPASRWIPKRHKGILKWKPFQDDEATITGFTSGRETAKGSKHLGKIGALITDYKGKRLELSGLTDAEREFASCRDTTFAEQHPGEDMPRDAQGTHFKVGRTVTFRYRELTDDQIPKEARYWRRRDME
jgi:DNA ligase 1